MGQEVGTKGLLITPDKHLHRLEFSLSLTAKGYQYISDISLLVISNSITSSSAPSYLAGSSALYIMTSMTTLLLYSRVLYMRHNDFAVVQTSPPLLM